LAARLGMPLQRCMAETTSTEFMQWQQYFRQELEDPKREELYLAQIAAEVRRFVAKHPRNIKISDFVLKLTSKSKEVDDDEVDFDDDTDDGTNEKPTTSRTTKSKAFWFTLAGTTTKE